MKHGSEYIKERRNKSSRNAAGAMALLLAAALLSACGSGKTADAQVAADAQVGADTQTAAAENGQEGEKLQVMASFYPMYDFAQKIGGDCVTVTDMVPAGTEPHDWEPAAKDIAGLENADVFVYSGAGLEYWAEDILQNIQNKDLVTVEASEGITLLTAEEEGSHEAEDGHDHGSYDPHVWLDPMKAKEEMANIRDAFSAADPAHAADYEANYQENAEKLDALDTKYRETLDKCSKKEIVVSHEAFGYLCSAYDITQMGIEGLMPDSEPDPARMAEITDFVREHDVRVIFSEELVSEKVAQTIAKETGAEVETLNPLEGLSEAELAAGADYFSVMEDNLTKLAAALA